MRLIFIEHFQRTSMYIDTLYMKMKLNNSPW